MKYYKWGIESKYIVFYFAWNFDLSFEICGYFDNRPRVNFGLIFFRLTLIFPFRNKWKNECVCPKWGIAFHNNTFWINKGGKGNMKGGNKWWTLHMPWEYTWVRRSTLLADRTWFNETAKNRLKWFVKGEGSFDWLQDNKWKEKFPYTYILKDGEVQNRIATVSISELEWRMRGLKWIGLFKKVRKGIDIEFDKEVGEETGSWKGGCTGCSYDLLPGEAPYECLKRMEKERKF